MPTFSLETLTPLRCRLILAAVLLIGFFSRFAYLNTNCPIDLSGDEAHYWDWSRQLDWSYYSKGPAVAYVIRFGCLIFGDNDLGVRFPSLLLAIGASICTYWITARAFGSERLALGAVMLCHVAPMFIAGSLLMTIDPPYYFAWAMATCLAFHAVTRGARWAWIGAGVFIGLSFLAKYAALLWLVCLLIYLIVDKPQRRWLRTVWPWATIGVAILFTIPVIVWNMQHDWVTFGHVARSTTENQSGLNPLTILSNFGLMIGSQIGILNPILAGFMIGGAIMGIRNRATSVNPSVFRVSTDTHGFTPVALKADPVAFLLCFSLPFLAFVAVVTIFKEIEPNWPAAAYFTLVPVGAWFVSRTWPGSKGWLIGAIAIGVVVVPLAHYSFLAYRLVPMPPKKWDPAARLHGWKQIGEEVSLLLRQSDLHNPFVLCDKYQLAGLMAFYVQGQPKTYCAGSYWSDAKKRDRLSQYDMWPDRALDQDLLRGRDAIYIGQDAEELGEVFDRVVKLPNLPIERNGVVLREQKIYVCYGFHGMTRPTDGKTKR